MSNARVNIQGLVKGCCMTLISKQNCGIILKPIFVKNQVLWFILRDGFLSVAVMYIEIMPTIVLTAENYAKVVALDENGRNYEYVERILELLHCIGCHRWILDEPLIY